DAGAAEEADLAAARVGRKQVDDLDAGLEGLHLGLLIDEGRRLAVDRVALGEGDVAALVDGLPDDIDYASERALAYRHGDRAAGVARLHAAHQAVGRVHGDAAHRALAEMLRNLDDEV